MILINAENRVMGRISTFAAKKILQGEQVNVVNAEKAVISGSKEFAMQRLKTRLDLVKKGNPEGGAKYSRMPDKVLRMAIRGMLPWKSKRGREAYKKVHVFIGLPAQFEGNKFTELPDKAKSFRRSVELGEICRLLGAKF